MPAYFEMSLQFQRSELYPDFIRDFDAALDRAGLTFLSGCRWDGFPPRGEISAWNQRKLEENFVLGMDEPYSHDCRQSLYRFGGYSEVRGFWTNQHPVEDAFTYFLIIPESEVVDEGDHTIFLPDKAEQLRELAEKLWQFPLVRSIQTGLELSDPPLSLAELRKGQSPDASPFAIVEPDCHPYDDGSRAIELTRGRPGLLLLDNEELSGPVIEVPFGGPLRLEERGGR